MTPVRTIIVVTGTVLVVLYAQLMYVVTQILTPLSTVPGRTLGQIAVAAEAAGEPVFTPLAVALPLVGVALAATVLVAAIMFPVFRTEWVALAYLALLVCGLPAYVGVAFGVGMSLGDLGDVLPIDGSDSEVGLVLVSTSFVACFLVLGVGAGVLVHRAGRGVGKLAAFRPAR
ncbi:MULTISPECIES: hypothetical protein [Microbacterium]|uniref:hypothetical protein n=1 Tax=Microbacterium TaxID=33882 RepID=UPI00344DA2E8